MFERDKIRTLLKERMNSLLLLILLAPIIVLSLLKNFELSVFKSLDILKYYPFILFIGWVPFLFLHMSSRYKKFIDTKDGLSQYDIDYKTCIAIVLIISTLVFTYKFLINSQPQGYDTARYMYSIQKILSAKNDQEIIKNLEMTHFSICVIIMFISKLLFWMDIELVFIIVPVLIGIFYIFSYFYFVKYITGNNLFSLITCIIVSTWYPTVQMNNTLFAQNVGFSLMLIWFGVWFGEFSPLNNRYVNDRKMKLFLMSISNMVIALFHVFTWIIMGMITIAYFIVVSNRQPISEERRYSFEFMTDTLISFVPAAFVSALLLFFLSFDTIYYIINPFTTQLTFDRLLTSASKDTLILIILLLFSPIVMIKYFHMNITKILVSWISALGLLSLFTGFPRLHRYLMLEPVPLFVGFVIFDLFESARTFNVKTFKGNTKVVYTFLTVLMITQVSMFLPNAYNSAEVSRPTIEVVEELQWIKDNYGFSNDSVTVFLNSRNTVDYEWCLALTGDPLYVGEKFRLWYNNELTPWEELRKVDLNVRLPGAMYTGSIYNAVKIAESKFLLVPESTIDVYTEDIIDYMILKNSTFIEKPGIFVVDIEDCKKIDFNMNEFIKQLSIIADNVYMINTFPLIFPRLETELYKESNISYVESDVTEISFSGPTNDWIILEADVASAEYNYVTLNCYSEADLNLAILYSDGRRSYLNVKTDEYGLFSSSIENGDIDKIRISIPPTIDPKDFEVFVNYLILSKLP